jgi:hypothetical protein
MTMLFAAVHESLLGTLRTRAIKLMKSAHRGKADIEVADPRPGNDPAETSAGSPQACVP